MSLSEKEIISATPHVIEHNTKPLTAAIVKRDGRKMSFCLNKIASAMQKAFRAGGGARDEDYLLKLATKVDEQLAYLSIKEPTVE